MNRAILSAAVVLAALGGVAGAADRPASVPVIEAPKAATSMPAWASTQRELLEVNGQIARQWTRAYMRADGTFNMQFIHGGGSQAPDDFFESIYKMPLLYSLGAPDSTLQTYWTAWKGSLKQLTAQGLLVNEMAKYLDWHHNGEHYEGFWLLALCIPNDAEYRRLSLKYASFFDGTESNVPNYDPKTKVIRSMNCGGAGPIINCRIRDWVEDAVVDANAATVAAVLADLNARLAAMVAKLPAAEPNAPKGKAAAEPNEVRLLRQQIGLVEFWSHWLDCAHDGPANLNTTCFGTNAFLLTGDANYRRRTLEYIDAWRDRAKANGGMVPSIVRHDGSVPKEWWGGVMGWDFKYFGGLFQVSGGPRAAWANALLMTGDRGYYDELRCEADEVWKNRITENGQVDVPRYRGAEGWHGRLYNGVGGGQNAAGIYASIQANVYLATMAPADLERVLDRPVQGMAGHAAWHEGGYESDWIRYLAGRDAGWADRALASALKAAKDDLAFLEKEKGVDEVPPRDNIAVRGVAGVLTNTMTGGIMPLWHGQLLLSRFRYFDPQLRRPGISEDCAALVEAMTDDSATLVLVNTSAEKAHTVLVQTGAYAEHQCLSVTPEGAKEHPINGTLFAVKLAPGAGQRFVVKMRRYANTPTARLPWPAAE